MLYFDFQAFKKYEDLAAKDEERRERLALREKQTKEREKNTLPGQF